MITINAYNKTVIVRLFVLELGVVKGWFCVVCTQNIDVVEFSTAFHVWSIFYSSQV